MKPSAGPTVIAQPDRFRRVGLFLVAVGVACASTGVADVAAQSADGASRAETAAGAGSPPATALTSGPPVGHEHWSFELLDALDIAGVSDAWMVTMRPVGREVVRRELDRTTNVDGAPGQGWERWLDRFDAEMPTRFGGAGPMAELAASGGTRSGDAFLEPGVGVHQPASGFGDRLVLEKPARGLPQHLLFLAAHEHDWASWRRG